MDFLLFVTKVQSQALENNKLLNFVFEISSILGKSHKIFIPKGTYTSRIACNWMLANLSKCYTLL